MSSRFSLALPSLAALLCAGLTTVFGDNGTPLTDEELLKHFTHPEGFDATIFASPPNISYPIFLTATPDGSLFVGCDENGSLDQKTGRGRVVLCEDTKGTGKADRFTTFARMDSPRGVAWDGSTRTLYVMHPPTLTAYRDPGHTGAATEQEDLITGLGFELSARGADHTINGIRLGIDGWIYIACGDYGAPKAVGKDGRSLSLRGGGILRVRPDGSGMEMVVTGTRNILAVAIAPTLDLFTSDNTNDGDDWNDRLSFNPVGAQMGYPSLFRNFADEIIPTMIDYGGGSPVGSIYVDEALIPAPWGQGFYSVEWGRGEIDLHPLTPNGAGWKADTKTFLKMNRATDMEVDGAGHMFVSSWEGATFTYNGPNAGYLVRLTPKGLKPFTVPQFATQNTDQLLDLLVCSSGVLRLAAQRELLHRGPNSEVIDRLAQLALRGIHPGGQVAAVFTLRQLAGADSTARLTAMADDKNRPGLREFALKALADDLRLVASVPVKPFISALNDRDPRVRLQAATGLGRLGKPEAAAALLPHTADADPVVSHIAIQSLRSLKAAEVCLAALDSPIDSPERPKIQRGALRVLQALYEPAVVQGLINRLGTENASLRLGIFQTLCRLDTREAAYTGIKQWWGTRPDTSGPIYQPERWSESDTIEKALRARLAASSGDEARQQVASLIRTKVSFPGMTDEILAKAGNDTSARMDVIASLLSPKTPASPELVRALSAIASSSKELPPARARALRLLAGLVEKSRPAVLDAFQAIAPVNPHRADTSPIDGTLAAVWEEFTRDLRHASAVGAFAKLSQDADPARRVLGTTVLTHLATSPVLKDERRRSEATNAIVRLWKNPETSVTLLGVIGRTRAGGFGSDIESRVSDANPEIAAAARYAKQRLAEDAGSGAAATTIASLPFKDVVARAVAAKGDAAVGHELFLKQGCSVCHTLSSKEPPKGPMLGGIATRYSRAELCESILKPSAKIAQGFESQSFTLKNGDQVDGFVVKEGGDSVEVRNLVGTSTVIEKGDIAERHKLEQSIMPEGLVANLTPGELASLLAFLESTSAK